MPDFITLSVAVAKSADAATSFLYQFGGPPRYQRGEYETILTQSQEALCERPNFFVLIGLGSDYYT